MKHPFLLLAVFVSGCFLFLTETGRADEAKVSTSDSSVSGEQKGASQDRKSDRVARDASPAATLGDPELLAGLEAYMNGQVDQCYRLFENAYRANAHLAPGGVLLALLFSNSGKYEPMRFWLEKAVEDHPDDPEAFFQLAGINLRSGHLVETDLLLKQGQILLARLEQLRRDSGEDPMSDYRFAWLTGEGFSLKAGLLEKQGKLAESESALRELTRIAPGRDDAWLSLGYVLLGRNKLPEAGKAFDEAHRINADNLSSWLLLASLLEDRGRRDEAQKQVPVNLSIEKLSELETDAYIRLLMKWSEMEEADRLAKLYHEKEMNSAVGWTLLGELALYRCDYAEAERLFRNAILVNSDSLPARQGLVWALMDQKNGTKLKEGRSLAYDLWQRDTDNGEANVPYAWSLYLSGRRDEAESLFQPILDSGHMSSTVAYCLAEMAYAKGNLGLAVNFLDLALDQDANFPKREAAEELRDLIAKKTTDRDQTPETESPVTNEGETEPAK